MDNSGSPALVPFHIDEDLTALSLYTPSQEDANLLAQPFIVGIAGGRCSGKRSMGSVLCDRIAHQNHLTGRQVLVLNQDDFYRELSDQERQLAQTGQLNMDHPDAFDFAHLDTVLASLRAGREVVLPVWDRTTFTRQPGATVTSKPDVVLLTGVLILYKRRIRQYMSLMVFVDIDSDTRLSRQVTALMETDEKGTGLTRMLRHYTFIAKPSFEEFILPTKRWADIIVPKGRGNQVAINMILQHMNELFKAP
ncbi:hypothetical protein H4R33_001104 [Dimargaris cristalligena]|uniref:uridine/cytidine kinase n=1 Tax=Dimargaris cristalligena TaxID=215637 RepID=A0A4P9ZMF9_9FUNG|nr:hypothetical protein H4R33_001104 [Dimargaris cristalligena]RKP34566.1 P-loop containing nucleoside triphosphate hydrolase protein [Dimargaris cristalligena]|eukprot:RKP34566.1 P-loop containing nucleoside triphosphate hydrolase protein [Dimargaris cristalligena]